MPYPASRKEDGKVGPRWYDTTRYDIKEMKGKRERGNIGRALPFLALSKHKQRAGQNRLVHISLAAYVARSSAQLRIKLIDGKTPDVFEHVIGMAQSEVWTSVLVNW